MKRKNNSIALSLLISAIFGFEAARAQPVMGYNNDKLSVTVPAIEIPQLDHPPYTSIFGNGYRRLFYTADKKLPAADSV